ARIVEDVYHGFVCEFVFDERERVVGEQETLGLFLTDSARGVDRDSASARDLARSLAADSVPLRRDLALGDGYEPIKFRSLGRRERRTDRAAVGRLAGRN